MPLGWERRDWAGEQAAMQEGAMDVLECAPSGVCAQSEGWGGACWGGAHMDDGLYLSRCACVCVYVCMYVCVCTSVEVRVYKKFKSREHLCVAMSSLFVGRRDGSVPAFHPRPNAYHDIAQSSYH